MRRQRETENLFSNQGIVRYCPGLALPDALTFFSVKNTQRGQSDSGGQEILLLLKSPQWHQMIVQLGTWLLWQLALKHSQASHSTVCVVEAFPSMGQKPDLFHAAYIILMMASCKVFFIFLFIFIYFFKLKYIRHLEWNCDIYRLYTKQVSFWQFVWLLCCIVGIKPVI